MEAVRNGESNGESNGDHMALIASIEEAFDIMMDTDDIVDLNSFEKGIELLKKYEIEI